MKLRNLFYCAFWLISFGVSAIPSNLKKSNIIVSNGYVYYFGFLEEGKNIQFKCLRYDIELAPADSFSMDLGPGKADQYHEIGVDTLHGFFNFYFQKKDNELRAKYLRLRSNLVKIFYNEDAEVNRINTQFIYDDDKIVFKNRIYCIRSPRDSAHKFFLACYELKDDKSFFDYEAKWGFRFYKFNYLRCKLLMADNEKVLVYVHALDGDKKGQYILSINAQNGELLKSATFNDDKALDQYTYYYSAHTFFPKAKEYFAGGISVRAGAEADLLLPKKSPVLFMIVLDEHAEVKYRFNAVAALPPGALKTKDMKFLCVRIKNIHVTENGLVEVISEVGGSVDGKKFRPYGYWLVCFTYEDGVAKTETNEYYDLISNKGNKLITKLPSDINGIVQIKSAAESDKALYMEHLQEVVVSCKAQGKGLKMIVKRKELNLKKIIYSEL
ncbi:MAG: hypothetical protein IAF38_04915, partial [Bacteroidia bacterium]|nr:hypothetical protein [Bacteroidia bacterium]